MELVLGKREELYWDKVPEKVRKEAVRRAVNFIPANTIAVDVEKADYPGEDRKRKRRKY
jgi:hypothetical protein